MDLGCRNQILKKFVLNNFIYTGVDITQNENNDNILMDLNKEILFELDIDANIDSIIQKIDNSNINNVIEEISLTSK